MATVRPPTDRLSVSQASRRTLATVLWQEALPEATGFGVGQLTMTPRYLSGQVVVSKSIANIPGNESVVMAEILAVKI